MLIHPAIGDAYARALEGAVAGESPDTDLPSAALDDADLLRRFAAVSDGRSAQGRDHPVAVVLRLCAAAVLAGMRSFTAIAGWVADVPVELLVVLHGRPAERDNSNIVHWSRFDKGGHFAALEVPEVVAGDIRAFFAGLR